jgi:uncharacterized protein YecE (DUF72 family)
VARRAKPDGQSSLFEMDKTGEPVEDKPEGRLFSGDPRILLGTSAFQAAGWSGSFYPVGMNSDDYLGYYASKFRTVEIDSTYYGTPAASTVENWYRKTPRDFIFAAKVPQVVTHTKMLIDCEAEFIEFVNRMSLLKEKLGPLLLQFPRFTQYEFKEGTDFLARLRPFLTKLPEMLTCKLTVEIRNKNWLNTEFLDTLRKHKVALALTDASFIPRPWELKEPLDLISSDFAYVRWLGNRKEIETHTTTWGKAIIDRTDDLRHWVELCRQFVAERKVKRLFLFGNNHYQGHGPDTVKTFWKLWNEVTITSIDP